MYTTRNVVVGHLALVPYPLESQCLVKVSSLAWNFLGFFRGWGKGKKKAEMQVCIVDTALRMWASMEAHALEPLVSGRLVAN